VKISTVENGYLVTVANIRPVVYVAKDFSELLDILEKIFKQ
jgi:hypothetical protein